MIDDAVYARAARKLLPQQAECDLRDDGRVGGVDADLGCCGCVRFASDV
jgi:hypothetical protein